MARCLLLEQFFNLIENMKRAKFSKEALIQKEIKKIVRKILNYLKLKNVSVDVFFLKNEEMITLEKKFIGKRKKIVEVLSFSQPENFPSPDKKGRFLGEIYLNKSVKNSKRLIYLLIHGILHLLGFDHQKKRDTIKMKELEKKILGWLLK